MDKQEAYLQNIRATYPELAVQSARLHTCDGQFNDILIVDNALIFRFPRSHQITDMLAHEVHLLRRIQPFLTLDIPNPIYSYLDPGPGDMAFMGYPMIPGEPLWNATLAAIEDETILEHLAAQLATFLRELHSVPTDALGADPPVADTPQEWAALGTQFREHLFPYMRPEAREQVTTHFQRYLDDPRQFAYRPTLRHGDFGTGNILYDPERQRITGVIDFSSACLGDPALDLAALLGMGETFVRRMYSVYPELEAMLERTTFYRGTYALQQALYALRDGDREAFDDGIAEYI